MPRASTPRIGGGVIARVSLMGQKNNEVPVLVTRDAANGLLRWQMTESKDNPWLRGSIFDASWCIADGRIHGLIGSNGDWGQAIDLADGRSALVYDQGIPAPNKPDAKLMQKLANEAKNWNRDTTAQGPKVSFPPYSLGLIHLASGGTIYQGGNSKADGEPTEIALGMVNPNPKDQNDPNSPKEPYQAKVTPARMLRGQVAALDAKTGQRRWLWEAEPGSHVAHLAFGEGVVVAGLTRSTVSLGMHYGNRWNRLHELVALDAATGQPRWRSDQVKDFSIHHFAIAEGSVFVHSLQIHNHSGAMSRMLRLSLKDGSVQFDKSYDDKELPQGADDWTNRFSVSGGRIRVGAQTSLFEFASGDGSITAKIPVKIGSYTKHPSLALSHCSTWRATANGWVAGRFARFIPYDGKTEFQTSAARNTCDEGNYPAYGMIYSGYHQGCYCATYLDGTVAMNSQGPGEAMPDDQRLLRGPAWGTAPGAPVAVGQWPTFRADAWRSAFCDTRLGQTLTLAWSARIAQGLPPVALSKGWPESSPGVQLPNGPIAQDWPRARMPTITAPVVAEGLILAAEVHQRRLVAFSLADGKERWSRPLASRLEYPPTIHRGLAFIGGNDGTVSCLRLIDGALVWRFTAAHNDRRVVSGGQVESAWPVPGVLVHQDLVYASAGRHNHLDGGIRIWVLDPATGTIRGRHHIDGRRSNQPPFDQLPYAHDFDGRSNDLLSTDRNSMAIHLSDITINPVTGAWTNQCVFLDRKFTSHAGFLAADLAKFSTRPMDTRGALHSPDTMHYGGGGLGIKDGMIGLGQCIGGRTMAIGADRLVTTDNGASLTLAKLDADGVPIPIPKELREAKRGAEFRPNLSKEYRPITGLAMTPDLIVAALPFIYSNSAILRLIGFDGTVLAEVPLPADPIPGSLAIAGTDIVVGTVDGRFHRFTTK
jgi:outer membrane protein assembly factor BamB